MPAVYKIAMAGACGVAAGVLAMGLLHGQAAPAPPPAYLISNAESVTDSAMLAQYGAAVGKTLAAFGGHMIVRGAVPVGLDASTLPKGVFVVVQFSSMKALQDWWHSPAYSAIRPLREKSVVGRLFALEGAASP